MTRRRTVGVIAAAVVAYFVSFTAFVTGSLAGLAFVSGKARWWLISILVTGSVAEFTLYVRWALPRLNASYMPCPHPGAWSFNFPFLATVEHSHMRCVVVVEQTHFIRFLYRHVGYIYYPYDDSPELRAVNDGFRLGGDGCLHAYATWRPATGWTCGRGRGSPDDGFCLDACVDGAPVPNVEESSAAVGGRDSAELPR